MLVTMIKQNCMCMKHAQTELFKNKKLTSQNATFNLKKKVSVGRHGILPTEESYEIHLGSKTNYRINISPPVCALL